MFVIAIDAPRLNSNFLSSLYLKFLSHQMKGIVLVQHYLNIYKSLFKQREYRVCIKTTSYYFLKDVLHNIMLFHFIIKQFLRYMKIKEERPKQSLESRLAERERPQSLPFTYKRHSNTYYIPVYPRAYVEEVINIDYDRRTVTAKFVVMVTVCTKVENEPLQAFLRDHLILEFGYNQVIFIPEHITLENSPFLITRMGQKDQGYVTYRIKGAIQCSAFFDCMYFPYRSIEIVNHLCIRPQEFKMRDERNVETLIIIKYNIMMLAEGQQSKYSQFLPYLGRKKFGNFKIDHYSSLAVADVDPHVIQLSVSEMTKSIFDMIMKESSKNIQGKKERPLMELLAKLVQPNSENERIGEEEMHHLNKDDEEDVDLQPFQHMAFRFTMSSISIGFVWQHEIPIWILSVVSLFLFEAQPNIGNKYSNIILLLVSYVSVISNFRRNNIAQQTLTFFEFKLMALTLVPILLIITTAIDYYNMERFNNRSDQVYNPFAIASIAIVLSFLAFTLGFLLYLWISKFLCEKMPESGIADDMIDWINMVELQWGHDKLEKKIKCILTSSRGEKLFKFLSSKSSDQNIKRESKTNEVIKIKQTYSQEENFA